MTRFRRTSRSGRVMVASAAILAFSLVGYGSAALASAPPTPQASGTEPAMDLAGAPNGQPSNAIDGGSGTKAEDGKNRSATGQTGKVVDQDCGLDAPTATRPDAPVKPSDDVRPPAPGSKTEPSIGARSVVVPDGGKKAKGPEPGAVFLPELREGPNGVKGFVAPVPECAVPEPVDKRPVKRLPAVGTCSDPATDQPKGSGGGSAAQPNPGALSEPDEAQAEDLPAGDSSPGCVGSDPDSPVSSDGDPEPAVDLPAVPADSVGAQEPGDAGPAE